MLHLFNGDQTLSRDTGGGGGTNSINFKHSGNTVAAAQIQATYTGDFRANLIFNINTSQSDTSPIEVARITNGGNLGIGTSSPQAKLVASNGGANGYELDPANGFISAYNRSTSAWTKITTRASSYTFNLSNTNDALNIDSSGNLGIGTTSPAAKLDVFTTSDTVAKFARDLTTDVGLLIRANDDGPFIDTSGVHALRFFTNGSERARIDPSGNLLVGTSSNIINDNARLAVVGFEGIRAQATANGGGSIGAFASNSQTVHFVGYDLTASAIKFQVLFNGNVQNTNNSYGAISDVKLKENIVDASPKLVDLMQVKVRNYNFKNDPNHKQLGVIAQELEQVFPAMIEETPDRDAKINDLGTKTKSVKYSVFVPMLIKAMQEQQVMINELMAKVATLESK
jgi:hypothetical protein